jgi:hypothetical protein
VGEPQMTGTATSVEHTSEQRLDVFLTVDVEIWCDGWNGIDAKFANAFNRYIYGPTELGQYGLPLQLQLLCDHGLTGVFFVEPLFAARFGLDALAEIVALVGNAGHEIQLHLHTEWVDEAREPLLPIDVRKRQFLTQFSLGEQTALIGVGRNLLMDAGARRPNAFRAGSFACNRDTLSALRANGIGIDCSYNATMFGPESGINCGAPLYDAAEVCGILEFPMTVFKAVGCGPRHVQLGACSFSEIEGLLWNALRAGQRSFVILSHSFELLNVAKNRVDPVVLKRFRKLCAFLERNADSFHVRGFEGAQGAGAARASGPLASPLWKVGLRNAEQLYRRWYQ